MSVQNLPAVITNTTALATTGKNLPAVIKQGSTALATVAKGSNLPAVVQQGSTALTTIGQAATKAPTSKGKIVAVAVAALAALGLIAKTASDNKEAQKQSAVYA